MPSDSILNPDFLRSFRTKYPAYDKVPDDQLSEAILKKWPVYQKYAIPRQQQRPMMGTAVQAGAAYESGAGGGASLHEAATRIQGARSAVANAPVIKQAGEVGHAVGGFLGNLPVVKQVGQAAGFAVGKGIEAGLHLLNATPQGRQVMQYIEQHPQQAHDIGTILQAGFDVASIIPLVGEGTAGASMIARLALLARRSEGVLTDVERSAALREAMTNMRPTAPAVRDAGQQVGERGRALLGKIQSDTLSRTQLASGAEAQVPRTSIRAVDRVLPTDKAPFSKAAKGYEYTGQPLKNVQVNRSGAEMADQAVQSITEQQREITNNATRLAERIGAAAKERGVVGGARREFSIPRWGLRALGAAGRTIIGMAHRVDVANTRDGNLLKRIMDDLPRLTEQDGWQLENVLEGRTKLTDVPSRVRDWVSKWQSILQEYLPTRWREAGVLDENNKLLDPRQMYSAHKLDYNKYDKLAKDPAKLAQLIQWVARNNNMDEKAAAGALRSLREHYTLDPAKRSFQYMRDNIRLPRDIQMNPAAALPRHFIAVTREANRALTFGAKNEKIAGELSKIAQEHGDAALNWVHGRLGTLMGIPQGFDTALYRIVGTSANILLPTVASPRWLVKHAFQMTNTARITGWSRILRGVADSFSPEGKATLNRLREMVSQADVMSIYDHSPLASTNPLTKASRAITNVTTVGLPRVYRFFKTFSAVAGRKYAEDALQVLKTNKAMGELTPIKAQHLFDMAGASKIATMQGPALEDALDHAAAFVGEETFFGGSSLLDSQFMDTPFGRASMLLRQYAFREMHFMWDQTVSAVQEGGTKALPAIAEMLATKVAGGYVTNATIRGIQRGLLRIATGQWKTLEDFRRDFSSGKPSPEAGALDAVITALTMWPLDALLTGHIRDAITPLMLSQGETLERAVVDPLKTWHNAGFAGQYAGRVGEMIGRNVLSAVVPTDTKAPLKFIWDKIHQNPYTPP